MLLRLSVNTYVSCWVICIVFIAMSIALSYALRIFWYPGSLSDIWVLLLGLYTPEPTVLPSIWPPKSSTIIYKDNAACITQINAGYIKGDQIQHILPKFLFTHELLRLDINVMQVRLNDNLANLFTKSLPTTRHRRIVQVIRMRRFSFLPDM